MSGEELVEPTCQLLSCPAELPAPPTLVCSLFNREGYQRERISAKVPPGNLHQDKAPGREEFGEQSWIARVVAGAVTEVRCLCSSSFFDRRTGFPHGPIRNMFNAFPLRGKAVSYEEDIKPTATDIQSATNGALHRIKDISVEELRVAKGGQLLGSTNQPAPPKFS